MSITENNISTLDYKYGFFYEEFWHILYEFNYILMYKLLNSSVFLCIFHS